jgi:hypothetical protein
MKDNTTRIYQDWRFINSIDAKSEDTTNLLSPFPKESNCH